MRIKFPLFALFFLTLLGYGVSTPARAGGCGHRIGLGVGVVHRDTPSDTNFSIGGEYECRLNPIVGLGAFFNHVFDDPSYSLIGVPQILVHPLGGDFFVAGSPVMQFGSGIATKLGLRLNTRVPLPLGLFILVPSFAVDFIDGGRNYWFGLGLQF